MEALQPAIPPQTPHIDYSEEASEYERKLVQVRLIGFTFRSELMVRFFLRFDGSTYGLRWLEFVPRKIPDKTWC
jgi:hypothetical protein